jgi:hypothetical protein
MALKIVVAGKISRAVWTLVTLGGGRFGRILAVSRQTHLASRSTWIRLRGQRPRKRKGAVAWVISRVGCDELMVMLGVVLLLLVWRAFPACIAGGSAFHSRHTCRVGRVAITKTREADWARLHIVARDVDLVRDDERLCRLISLVVCRRRLLRSV